MKIYNCRLLLALPVFVGIMATGCDNQIYDDLEPCPTNYHLKLRYDYNIKDADAFPKEVGSVAVWAFDTSGKLVWQHKESGEALASEDYRIDVPLPPGKYDFITWCGLSGESKFVIDTETPLSITDLGTTLNIGSLTRDENDMKVSDSRLDGLYHDIKRDVEITHDPSTATDNEIAMSLTKDTNYFKILLQNLDGSELKPEDFTFRITGGNTRLEYDNNPGSGEEFHYKPWGVTSGMASVEGSNPSEGTITSVSSLLAELHTSRLMKDGDYQLIVHRNSDNTDIITIPLIDYLLLVKGNYNKMDDQEYLDRHDEHALVFFLNRENNWNREIGIYINAWHVVPPQDTTLH